MNAQPGWYDAGVPGRQRWWDGTQWSAHEREALPPMGWFPVPGTTDVRWWDGAGWTPYRLRDSGPRPDAFAIEPGGTGLTLGFVFIVLGFTQFGTYNLSGQPLFAFTPVLFFVSGAVWVIGGFRANRLKQISPPSTVPVFAPSTRPLPGEVEGPSAGWYPVSGSVTRWWSGTRWSGYVGQKLGVRPTHSGARTYRTAMILGGVLAGVGVVGAAFCFFVITALGRWASMMIVIPAVIFVLGGVAVLLSVHLRRYTLIVPPQPPRA